MLGEEEMEARLEGVPWGFSKVSLSRKAWEPGSELRFLPTSTP